jgi:hypothetical protein
MSSLIASSPTRAPAVRDAAASADLDRRHETGRSWLTTLVEALAYAGAPFDPTAALAARRLARLRDEELLRGR